MTYSQKLKDPKWQKKRLQILERDGWRCQSCSSTTKSLQVHHLVYAKRDPWDYADECYQTLCEDCHKTRQELADKICNAIKLAIKTIPTERLQEVAQEIFNRASLTPERWHVVSTLHDSFNKSEQGGCILEHGLFSDAVMDLLSIQLLDSDRAKLTLPTVLEKLNGVSK